MQLPNNLLTTDHRAAIVYANAFQFGSNDRIHYPEVHSRMFMWCKSGRGVVRANKVNYTLTPDHYLMLPWGHTVSYQADRNDPFMIAAIHFIPDHDYNHDIVYQVAHFPENELFGLPWRRDRELFLGNQVHSGVISWSGTLGYLVEYILHLFLRDNPGEWQARYLAQLLIEELLNALEPTAHYSQSIPGELQQIMQYVRNHVTRPLSLDELSQFSGKSASTVTRMFRRNLNCTPNQWIQSYRIELACRLLRTSRLLVAEVGRSVGIDDQYYFSKLFKKMTGTSPLAYRKRGSLL